MSLNSTEQARLSTIRKRTKELDKLIVFGPDFNKVYFEEWVSLIQEWGVLTRKWGEDSPKHPNHGGKDSFSVHVGC